LKSLLYIFGLIAVIFVAAVLVDQIAVLKQVDAYFKEHPQPWINLTVVSTGLGLVLLIVAWISWGRLASQPMTDEEAHEYMRTRGAPLRRSGVFRGKAAGRETPEGVASFRQIKDAFRTGDWLRDPWIRPFCVGMVGLLLAVLGGFGFFVVTSPPLVKLICAGAVLYAFGRTGWAFWKA